LAASPKPAARLCSFNPRLRAIEQIDAARRPNPAMTSLLSR